MHRAEYLLWLKHMGLSSKGKLLPAIEYFSSPEEIYNADKEALLECAMFSEKEIAYLLKKDMSFVSEEIERCNKERCYLVDYYSKFYPEALRKLSDPPLILYVKGKREALSEGSFVTVAGSREADSYGIAQASAIASGFALSGFNIVSGMAHGVDSASASAAVNSGGKVIGVLCSGMDVDYPKDSGALREKIIASGGAVISEFEMGTVPQAGYFHIRNRIMAALSPLTVIVQAGEKSGAMITARLAKKLNKRVAAVPNPIDSPSARGVNSLIAEGAEVIYDVPLFVSEYLGEVKNEKKEPETEKKPLPEVKKAPSRRAVSEGNTESDNMMELTKLLKDGPLSKEKIAEISKRSIKWVNSTLIILEVSGRVKLLPDGRYSL